MKIINKTVWQMTDDPTEYIKIEEESTEYIGRVALATGGGNGGGTTIQKTEPWEQAKPYYTRLYDIGEQALTDPAQFFPGGTIAPQTGMGLESQEMLTGYAGDIGQMFGTAAGSYGDVLGGQYMTPQYGAGQAAMEGILGGTGQPQYGAGQESVEDIMSGRYLDPSTNPYLQRNVQAAVGDVIGQFEQQALPSIRQQAIGTGQYGGSRQGIAEGQAYEAALSEGMQTASEMYGRNLEQERARQQDMLKSYQQAGLGAQDIQLGALGQYAGDVQAGLGQTLGAIGGLGQFTQEGMLPATLIGDIGAQQRAEEQARLDEQIARWDFTQGQDWAGIQNMAALLSGGDFTRMTSQAPGRPVGETLLGYGTTLAGAMQD